MFSGLGGDDEYVPMKAKSQIEGDEFHLDGLDAEADPIPSVDFESLEAILQRHSLPLEDLDRVQGEEKQNLSSKMYRQLAIRDNRIAKWSLEQCAQLHQEYLKCFETTSFRIPYFTCHEEQLTYSNCLDIAKVQTCIDDSGQAAWPSLSKCPERLLTTYFYPSSQKKAGQAVKNYHSRTADSINELLALPSDPTGSQKRL
jgi:hypothetical protein